MNLENLAQHIQSRPDLDFGTIFSRSIELFKKVWLQGINGYVYIAQLVKSVDVHNKALHSACTTILYFVLRANDSCRNYGS